MWLLKYLIFTASGWLKATGVASTTITVGQRREYAEQLDKQKRKNILPSMFYLIILLRTQHSNYLFLTRARDSGPQRPALSSLFGADLSPGASRLSTFPRALILWNHQSRCFIATPQPFISCHHVCHACTADRRGLSSHASPIWNCSICHAKQTATLIGSPILHLGYH